MTREISCVYFREGGLAGSLGGLHVLMSCAHPDTPDSERSFSEESAVHLGDCAGFFPTNFRNSPITFYCLPE